MTERANDENSPSNFEGVSGAAGRGSLHSIEGVSGAAGRGSLQNVVKPPLF